MYFFDLPKQKCPNDLTLINNYQLLQAYYTLFGNDTVFVVSIAAGTGVDFDWDMGDATEKKKEGNQSSLEDLDKQDSC